MFKRGVFMSKSLVLHLIHLGLHILLTPGAWCKINPYSSNFTQIFNPHNISSSFTLCEPLARIQVYFLGIIRCEYT